MTIWKFPLQPGDHTMISIPKGSHLLCVQTQQGDPMLWALIPDPGATMVQRKISIFGTGHIIPGDIGGWIYIGTFQIDHGALVFHVFEQITELRGI